MSDYLTLSLLVLIGIIAQQFRFFATEHAIPLALGSVDDTLAAMTRLQAACWAILSLAIGGSLLGYLLTTVSPYAAGQLNLLVIGLFLGALLLGVFGLGAAVALMIHARFPSVGGGTRLRPPPPTVALRQGLLVACAVVAILLLAFFQIVDIVFIIAIILLTGLIEAYLRRQG